MKLIYCSPIPWDSFAQRSHEMVRYFHATTGGLVLWVDPYPTRLPSLQDCRRIKPVGNTPSTPTPPWLSVAKPRALPIEPLRFLWPLHERFLAPVVQQAQAFCDSDTQLVVGKPSLLALRLMEQLRVSHRIYDAMDNFPAFYEGLSAKAMARVEHKIAAHAEHIITSSHHTQARMAGYDARQQLLLNACATDRLPVMQALKKQSEAPVLGYVGTLGHWFDWELLAQIASANPLALVRVIGPLYVPPTVALPNNVRLEPVREHADALLAMTEFDVGLIPFKVNALTDGVDPIKYYEYRALGLPVISSSFGEMAQRHGEEGVYLAGQHYAPHEAVQRALAYHTDKASALSFRALNSWQVRFSQAGLFTTP